MVKIMSDTSTLLSIEEGAARGIVIAPLSVTIDNHTYREYEEISSSELLGLIAQGHIPTSSQPAIGEVLAGFEKLAGNEIIDIAMADGLSGTYETVCAAREQASNKEDITVVNTRTLAGPHRYMTLRAVEMAESNATKDEILAMLDAAMASARSFLIPADFNFLRRGGRLSPLAANMIGKLKVTPILTQASDGKRLDPHMVHRSQKALYRDIVNSFRRHGLEEGKGWLISILHAGNVERSLEIKAACAESFPYAEIEIGELSPVFVVQGGPRCVAVQVVKKQD